MCHRLPQDTATPSLPARSTRHFAPVSEAVYYFILHSATLTKSHTLQGWNRACCGDSVRAEFHRQQRAENTTVDSSPCYVTLFLRHSGRLITNTCPNLSRASVLLRPQHCLLPTLDMQPHMLMGDGWERCAEKCATQGTEHFQGLA